MRTHAAGAAGASADTETPLSGEIFGALINLSGRRRFTSQCLVLFAVLGLHGEAGATQTARDALKLFRDAHTVLVHGDRTLPGIFCPELNDAYFGSLGADRAVLAFIDLAERALQAIDSGSAAAPELLAELTRSTTPTLAILNQLTTIYEEQSKRHAVLMKKQLRGVITDIETIAKQAKMVAFNARIVAARAGQAGKEFAVVAGVLSNITIEIDDMVRVALRST
ncbi:MAG: methyl-accepting chemotaxis protein [Massilia sp.]